MQTDKIKIRDYSRGMEEALVEADKFSGYMEYDCKSQRRVRLLVEESFGMLSAITEKFKGDFWLEGKRDGFCQIHFVAQTDMDIMKKRELIDASRNKKNAAYRGLRGKLLELIEDSVYFDDNDGRKQQDRSNGQRYIMMGMTDVSMAPGAPMPMNDYIWSLGNYRQGVEQAMESDDEAGEAWDELEKSILANLADDIRVAVKGNTVELVIEKRFDLT